MYITFKLSLIKLLMDLDHPMGHVHLQNLATLPSDFVVYTFNLHKWTISKIQLKTQEVGPQKLVSSSWW
jgi:hypothetical protein